MIKYYRKHTEPVQSYESKNVLIGFFVFRDENQNQTFMRRANKGMCTKEGFDCKLEIESWNESDQHFGGRAIKQNWDWCDTKNIGFRGSSSLTSQGSLISELV